jgi:uncharacterized protein YcbX
MLSVSDLFIYPVKSLGGIAVNSALLTDRGFEYDRRWMVIDKENRFITQRELPAMALLQVQVTETGLRIQHKTKRTESTDVPFQPLLPHTVPVMVWDDICEAQYASSRVDEWLSDMLSFDCRLVYMPDRSLRRVDTRYAANDEITSLSDGYPVLMIGQASLDDVNRRMAIPLPMNRFRPNIVFSGGSPFEEDTMAHFRIKEMDFYAVKPCARCVMTTINQDNAVAAKEPLKTLAAYRSKDNKVYFGQNILYRGSGVIQVGDRIEVVERRPAIDFERREIGI